MPEKTEILDIAIALADDRGLAAVSMRAVAERVGVTPMALYPYIGNKAALLDGMLGRLLGDLSPPAGGEPAGGEPAGEPGAAAGKGAGVPWPDRLTATARSARAMVIAHPWSAGLVFVRPSVTPDSVRAVDLLYTALLDAGVPAPEVPRLERMLSTVVIGFAASEAGGRFGAQDDPRSYRGLLPSGTLPGHARLRAALDRPVDWDAEFEADLADLLLLIAAVARPGAGTAPGPGRAGPGAGSRQEETGRPAR